jgi:hypothetical protein
MIPIKISTENVVTVRTIYIIRLIVILSPWGKLSYEPTITPLIQMNNTDNDINKTPTNITQVVIITALYISVSPVK